MRPQRDRPEAIDQSDSANLDLLRSVAVLLVLIFHLGLTLVPGRFPVRPLNLGVIGRWGVLIFFVHTSYVLMLSLERQVRRSPTDPYYSEFMTRRAFRLLPLNATVVLGVTALGLPVADVPFRVATHPAAAMVTNLLEVQNITKSDSVVVTLWTLPYEVQMYLLLPALFWFSRRSRTLLPVLALWCACVAGSKLWLPYFGQFYDMARYAPCFVAGVVGYSYARVRIGRAPYWMWPIAIGLISLIYLRRPTISTSWACCLALGFCLPSFRELPEGLVRESSRLVARYSYGIYLTHMICIWLAFVAFAARPWAVQWLIFLTTVVALPVVLYHAIEAPMIARGRRLVDARRTGRELRAALQPQTT